MKEIKSVGEFEQVSEKEVVLVDFYAEWCGPCQMMLPIIEELAGEYEKNENVEIVKINIDEVPQIPARFNVMSVPTFLFLTDGKEIDRIVGASPKENLSAVIEKLLKKK